VNKNDYFAQEKTTWRAKKVLLNKSLKGVEAFSCQYQIVRLVKN